MQKIISIFLDLPLLATKVFDRFTLKHLGRSSDFPAPTSSFFNLLFLIFYFQGAWRACVQLTFLILIINHVRNSSALQVFSGGQRPPRTRESLPGKGMLILLRGGWISPPPPVRDPSPRYRPWASLPPPGEV